jgi:hypothetical protein
VNKRGILGVFLVLLLAGIMMAPFLWAGRVPTVGSTFQSSILPTPRPGTPVPTRGTVHPPTAPPATVVFPTPPTPIPNAPEISAEQAGSIAMSQSPVWAQMLQRGELTVTTKLTVHGDTDALTSRLLMFHPLLRVWVVYFHTPPLPRPGGPAGQVPNNLPLNTVAYEIDAVTGQVMGHLSTFVTNGATPTLTPEAAP